MTKMINKIINNINKINKMTNKINKMTNKMITGPPWGEHVPNPPRPGPRTGGPWVLSLTAPRRRCCDGVRTVSRQS